MNTSLWDALTKTVLLGTARAPLSEALERQAAALGLQPGEEPARTALELLAALGLLRKAGFPLAETGAPLPAPALAEASSAPFPTALFPALELILAGVYAPALDELLALTAGRNWALPPEYLPALLDRAARDGVFFEKIRPALGPRGEWLAAQHPRWRDLYAAGEAPDWATGRFADRLRWLRDVRATRPLVGLALLEKTWRAERPDHKKAFLQALTAGLSAADEDFLEKIRRADKNREVRQTALALLLQIPNGQTRVALTDFFRLRVAGVFSAGSPRAFLKKQLPAIDESWPAALAALLPPAEVKNWRPGLVALLVRLLPPAETAAASGLSPARLLAVAAENPDLEAVFPALVHAAADFRDADWLAAVAQFLRKNPALPLWRAAPVGLALDALPDAAWADALTALLQDGDLLAEPGSPLVAALQIAQRPWPGAVLSAFLNRLIRTPIQLPHLQDLLEKAAYRCRPEEAGALRVFYSEAAANGPWRAGLAYFFDVARFREMMWLID